MAAITCKGIGNIISHTYTQSALFKDKNVFYVRIDTKYGEETIHLIASRSPNATKYWLSELGSGVSMSFQGYIAGGKIYATEVSIKKEMQQLVLDLPEAS